MDITKIEPYLGGTLSVSNNGREIVTQPGNLTCKAKLDGFENRSLSSTVWRQQDGGSPTEFDRGVYAEPADVGKRVAYGEEDFK